MKTQETMTRVVAITSKVHDAGLHWDKYMEKVLSTGQLKQKCTVVIVRNR